MDIVVKEKNPFFSYSQSSTIANKTGSWRYLAPSVSQGLSPCEAACPLVIPISDFIHEIENNNIERAANLIRMENPFPSVCGRVCTHPCETKCNRDSFDRGVAIHMLERYIGDHFSAKHLPAKGSNLKSIAIVGAGPSGLSAAYFLRILGYDLTIFEAREKAGGMLEYGIPEYRMPKKILSAAINQVLSLGMNIEFNRVLGKNLSLKDLEIFDAIFLGTGAHHSKELYMDAGISKGVKSGLEILGWIYSGQKEQIPNKVVIIGGGNTAIDVARSLIRLGKKTVILYRRRIRDMRAFTQEIREVLREGIEIKERSVLKEIIYSGDVIAGLKCVKVNASQDSPNLNNTFSEEKNSEFYLEADLVVSAIGEIPDLAIFDNITTENGKVAIDRYGKTNLSNVFAGGDCIPGPHLVAHALASGKRAAVSIDASRHNLDLKMIFSLISIDHGGISFQKYLEIRKMLLDNEKNIFPLPDHVTTAKEINYNYFEHYERTKEKKLPLADRQTSFKEVHIGYDKDNVIHESRRCFHCGKCTFCDNCVVLCPDISIHKNSDKGELEIDLEYCKGCGICAEECPRGVIQMKKEGVRPLRGADT